MQQNDFSYAARFRDAVRRIVKTEINRERPRAALATVLTVNVTNKIAYVLFPGESIEAPVSMGALVPEVGAIVLVDGPSNGRYITDVISGEFRLGNQLPGTPGDPGPPGPPGGHEPVTVEEFSVGFGIWTNPGPGHFVEFTLIGGGGGGNGGACRGSGLQTNGGGGGGAGGLTVVRFFTDDLPALVDVFVAPGGPGGAGQTASSTTSPGSVAPNSAIGLFTSGITYAVAQGGQTSVVNGKGGLPGHGGPYPNILNVGAPGDGTGPYANSTWGNVTNQGPASGGAGGGWIDTADVHHGGGVAGPATPSIKQVLPGQSGNTNNIPGIRLYVQNCGGGGGSAFSGSNGQVGGTGGTPGGGGGGGSAARTGFTSGAGGAGGAGTAIAAVW